MACADLKRAHCLQQAFLKGASDAHHLARRFHLCGKAVAGAGEFVKREAGHFGHNIVKRRLKARGGVGQHYFVKRQPDRDLCRYSCNRESACLACKSGGARYARIDLDHIVIEGIGIKRKLHVTAALDLKAAYDLERAVAQHLIFAVCKRLTGADHDGVSGVYADRVKILHIADRNDGVVCVAHDLVFDLLIALYAFFDKHLMHRGKLQRVFKDQTTFLTVFRKPSACSAQCKGGAQDYGITDLLRGAHPFLHGFGYQRGTYRLAYPFAQRLEQLAVLRLLYAFALCAKQLGAALTQHALLFKLHCKIEAGLTAKPRNYGVGAFVADYLCHIFQRQRLHVDLVRDAGVGHDGGGIGVAEYDLIPLLLEREARLSACIIKFRALTDNDRTAADHHYFLQIRSLRHCDLLRTPSFPV